MKGTGRVPTGGRSTPTLNTTWPPWCCYVISRGPSADPARKNTENAENQGKTQSYSWGASGATVPLGSKGLTWIRPPRAPDLHATPHSPRKTARAAQGTSRARAAQDWIMVASPEAHPEVSECPPGSGLFSPPPPRRNLCPPPVRSASGQSGRCFRGQCLGRGSGRARGFNGKGRRSAPITS